jgi:RNase P subunit RPR2
MLLCLLAQKKPNKREVVMATTRSSPYGMACPHCNTSLIAPDGSRYVSKHEVYHFWSCEDCGHRIESVVDFRISITSQLINHVRPDLLA